MQTSVIRLRVADFLKRFPPFDALSEPDLLQLAGSGKVTFHQSGEYVLRQGDAKGKLVWIPQQGRVELFDEGPAGEQLRDVLGEGDLLGMERFVGDGCCLLSARTASDVILYGVDAGLLESMISRYPAAKRFLTAHFSIAAISRFGRTSWLDAEPPPTEFLEARLSTVPLDSSMAEVASLLSGASSGIVALIDESGRAAGMVTPMDFCTASGGSAGAALRPLPPIMTKALTTRGAVREMLRTRREELAITADGTPGSRLEAILTAAELALFCGQNPSLLANLIQRAGTVAEIVPLLRRGRELILGALAQPRDVDDCCRIESAMVDALASACFRLAQGKVLAAGHHPSTVPCCWFSFGESARGDALDLKPPAIAAVYDDSAEGFRPEDGICLSALTREIVSRFESCGLDSGDSCRPEGSRPCMPLSEWKRLYSDTLCNPLGGDLYARRELFDLRALFGDAAVLQKVQDHIVLELHDNTIAIPLLANDTLANLPPVTFFRGFVLELDGAQSDSFEIGSTALAPIAAAARVLAISQGRLAPAGTLERLQAAELDFPEFAQILRDAAVAFRIALYYKAVTGNRIEPGNLGKFDQRLLKSAFSSVLRLLEFTSSRFVPSV